MSRLYLPLFAGVLAGLVNAGSAAIAQQSAIAPGAV
jgi:hypothetical protein